MMPIDSLMPIKKRRTEDKSLSPFSKTSPGTKGQSSRYSDSNEKIFTESSQSSCPILRRMEVRAEEATSVLYIQYSFRPQTRCTFDLQRAKILLSIHVQIAATNCNVRFVEQRTDSFVCVCEAGPLSSLRDRPCALDRGNDVAHLLALASDLHSQLQSEPMLDPEAAAGLRIQMGISTGAAVFLGARSSDAVWAPQCILSNPDGAVTLSETVAAHAAAGTVALSRAALRCLRPGLPADTRSLADLAGRQRPVAAFDCDLRTIGPYEGTPAMSPLPSSLPLPAAAAPAAECGFNRSKRPGSGPAAGPCDRRTCSV
jgi:hypothetical protein